MKIIKALSLSLLLGLSSYSLAQTAETAKVAETVPAQEVEQTTTQIQTSTNTVNINTATAAEIQDKLVGIGAKKAQAIVDYRTKNGNFKSVEQLTEVSGIGQATLEKNRANIVLE
ncbi:MULTISPECIES: ComEA family DNA-binding protein [Mannheimia]|uniref:Helix-hairpin-helix domain-containing protein n=1 Tax=Mannheimia indoligenes TaxID=3103145 RepID=A0ABU7ZBX9_9PAST|nr:helix-hairpin-helix domain-containing protein [Mannheimia sp. USDA-ARS-USMARC-1261]AHG72494.1 DNA uptake protein ComE1 [Mannheimia sp. USDA-ARS-USMARC-1261]